MFDRLDKLDKLYKLYKLDRLDYILIYYLIYLIYFCIIILMITKFYINPISGRIIKSSGKIFRKLKKKKYSLKKEPCLYNIKSAKKCLSKLLKRYPNIVYPSSNFINIPKTYHINTIRGLRAFIRENDTIIAFINKHGIIYRLKKPIYIINENQSIPIVIDYYNNLPQIIKKLPKINSTMQKKVEYQLKNIKSLKNSYILYNHVQKDFIPINKKMDQSEHDKILRIFNNNLVKTSPKIYEISDYPKIKIEKKSPIPSRKSSIIKPVKKSPRIYEIPEYPKIKIEKKSPTISSDIPSITSTISSVVSSIPSTISSVVSSIPSTISSVVSSKPSSTPLSTKPISKTSSTEDFELSFINNKLVKTVEIPSSTTQTGIKVIQDENDNIIGYTEI